MHPRGGTSAPSTSSFASSSTKPRLASAVSISDKENTSNHSSRLISTSNSFAKMSAPAARQGTASTAPRRTSPPVEVVIDLTQDDDDDEDEEIRGQLQRMQRTGQQQPGTSALPSTSRPVRDDELEDLTRQMSALRTPTKATSSASSFRSTAKPASSSSTSLFGSSSSSSSASKSTSSSSSSSLARTAPASVASGHLEIFAATTPKANLPKPTLGRPSTLSSGMAGRAQTVAPADPSFPFPIFAASRAPPAVDLAQVKRMNAESSLRAVQSGEVGNKAAREKREEGKQFVGDEDNLVRMLREKLCMREEPSVLPAQPADLNVTLLPYQMDGVRWMVNNERGPVKGGLLADDMGLGKTVQVLALSLAHRPRERRPMLVVCLLSTLAQWENEVKNRIRRGCVSVLMHYGNSRTQTKDTLESYDIILTTYGTLTSEFKKKGPLFSVNWWRVVLDEAHMIKNKRTQGAKAAYQLQADHRWCLSGTPIQNCLEDLHSLLSFLNVPLVRDPHAWKTEFVAPFKSTVPATRQQGQRRLQLVLSSVLLRRTKNQLYNGRPILQLPEKRVFLESVAFTPEEQQVYDDLFNRAKQTFNNYMQAGTVSNNYMTMLEMLLRLRQACDHPQLALKSQASDESVRARPNDSICPICQQPFEDDVLATSCKHKFCGDCITSYLATDNQCPTCQSELNPDKLTRVELTSSRRSESSGTLHRSTKLTALLKALSKVNNERPGEKSVVFSQFTSFLDLIQKQLVKYNISFVRLDGSMPQNQRTQALDKFANDPRVTVMIISLKAGGTGLNLTMANHVFLLDPWWNPFTELQAIDRVHRLGQTRKVSVTRFVIRGTVEEKIVRLQEQKKELASQVVSAADDGRTQGKRENSNILNRLTVSELQFLFRSSS